MKILILTGRFGLGHISAAKALQQELEDTPYAEIKIIDIVEYVLPHMHSKIYKSFDTIAKKHPTLYNKAYTSSDSNFDLSFGTLFLKKLCNLLREEKPDVIVSTLFLATKLVSTYKEKNKVNIPLITCITDISSANEWLTNQTDFFLVATHGVKQELIQKGISKNKIIVSGIPVRQQFKQISNKNGLNKDQNNLLIMGGGLGLLPKSMVFYEKLNNLHNTKTTIITGNNKAMFDKLFNMFHNIEVIGYCDEVDKYMQNADIMLSKAGGITLFEAIHSELPIVVPRPFLAQEINNAHYIQAQRIGKVVWDEKQDLVSVIEDLFSNEVERKKMRDTMKSLKISLIDSPLSYVIDLMNLKEAAL